MNVVSNFSVPILKAASDRNLNYKQFYLYIRVISSHNNIYIYIYIHVSVKVKDSKYPKVYQGL